MFRREDLVAYKATMPVAEYQTRGQRIGEHPYVGRTFGRLTVKRVLGFGKTGQTILLCECECGVCFASSRANLSGGTVSCGCVKKQPKKPCDKLSPEEVRLRAKFATCKARANKKGFEFSLTKDQLKELLQGQCRYCGAGGEGSGLGVDRIDSLRGYVIDNVDTCCKTCNFGKNKYSEAEFGKWIDRVAEFRLF